MATFGLTFLSPLLILPGSVGVWRNPDRIRLLPWAALVWGVCLYALLVGGDFMAMGRFLVLGVPFLFLLLPVLIAPRFDRSTAGKRLTLAAGVLVIVLGLLPAWNVHLVPAVVRERFKFRLSAAKFRSEVEQFQFMQDNAELWRQKGLALAECTLPGDSVVDEAIGAMGYYSDRFVFDRAGLVTRNLLEDYPMGRAVAGERSPGHTRSLPPEFFLPEEPTILRARFTRSGRPKQEIALLAREWRGSRVGQMYVADFREAVDLVGGGRLFVFQRRMQRGPAEEWAGFQERWAQLRD